MKRQNRADEVIHVLQQGTGRRGATEAKHTQNGKGMHHPAIARFSVVGAESAQLAFLTPDILSEHLVESSFNRSVLLSTTVLFI
jgi:hypothetical protein